MNNLIQEVLGEEYVMLSSVSLQATHLVVFAHAPIVPLITEVKTDDIPTGFNKMVGNKGAVMIKMKLAETSIIFINCHLHSGQDNVETRNTDVQNILAKFIGQET